MGAWFQIKIECGSPSLFSRLLEGDDLGMIFSCLGMIPLPDNLTIFQQNGTDHGIGWCLSPPLFCEMEYPSHPVIIFSNHESNSD